MKTAEQITDLNRQDAIENAYKDFILTQKHPCIMAKTVFMMDAYHLKVYDDFDSDSAIRLLNDLGDYIAQYDFESHDFESFLAVFPNTNFESELEFENGLWSMLQQLHNFDDCEWDNTVSDDPHNAKFSFSIKGKAFYVVGLHPKSSRKARQSPYTTLVFNLHWQFEKLREMGTYKRVKKRIRKRDKKLQGSINPVLKDYGNDTEAKQYSGRPIGDAWKCPFLAKTQV